MGHPSHRSRERRIDTRTVVRGAVYWGVTALLAWSRMAGAEELVLFGAGSLREVRPGSLPITRPGMVQWCALSLDPLG
jgi:hypothetical protein